MPSHMDKSKDKPMMEKVAKKAVKGHEVKMHGVKKMARGGVTSAKMKQVGRGLAKVANQKVSSFTYKNSGRGR
jgi:hypothetical protein